MKFYFSLKSRYCYLSPFCVTAFPLPRFQIFKRNFRYLIHKRQQADKALRRFFIFSQPKHQQQTGLLFFSKSKFKEESL